MGASSNWELLPGRAILQAFGLVLPDKEDRGIILPEVFLKAAGELLGILFVVSWTITVLFNPDSIRHNPLKDRLGYNNFCVGLDTPPARYAAQVLFCVAYYTTIRYATLTLKRSFERRRMGQSTFKFVLSATADVLLMISMTAFSQVFVITPYANVWGHTLPFVGFIYVRYLVIFARMLESKATTTKGYVWLGAYGLISLCLPIYYLSSYGYYDSRKEGAREFLFPPWFGQTLDYTWFACLWATSVFMHTDEDDVTAMHAITAQYDKNTLAHLGEIVDDSDNAMLLGYGTAGVCLFGQCSLWAIGIIVYITTGVCVIDALAS